MKKFIPTLFLLLLFTGLQAQSVQETQAWILSKLSKYQRDFSFKSGDCADATQENNFSFKFQKDTLIVSCDIKVFFPSCFTGDKVQKEKNTATKLISKIPISDISNVESYNYKSVSNALRIETPLKTVRTIATFASGHIEYSYSNAVLIGLNFGTEEALLERLQKAFNHLVTFYPKKVAREAF